MRRTLFASIAFLVLASPGNAQSGGARISIGVDKISTTQTCNYFQNSEGRAAVVASPWAFAAASAWRTWWVKDCYANFATMRSTLSAALAAAPAIRVANGNGRYMASLNITQISDPDQPAPIAPEGGTFGIARSYMTASFDIIVRDAAGRSVFGTLITKKIEIGSDVKVDGFRATSNSGGDAAYGRLQNEIALAAARAVAFHFAPIEVVSGGGREVQLNYGGPYLKLGDLVLLSTAGGGSAVRYRVTSAASGGVSAEPDGDGAIDRVGPGSIGTFVEADDPAQNGRRFRKVDLP